MKLTTTIEYSPDNKADAFAAMKSVFAQIEEGKSHVMLRDQIIELRSLGNVRVEHRDWRPKVGSDSFYLLCFYHHSSDITYNNKTSFPNEIRIN